MNLHPVRWFRIAWSVVWWELVRQSPAITLAGVGLTATWFFAVHAPSTNGTVQSGYYSWLPMVFIAIGALGVILWVVRVVKKRMENPNNITIVDVDRKIDQLIGQTPGEPPQLLGSSVTVPAGSTVSVAVGVGPLVVDLSPGGTMSFPTGATVRSWHSAQDEAKTDDSVTGPSGNANRLRGDSASTSDEINR